MTADILALAASSNPGGVAWRNLDDDAELTLGQWNDAADRLARGLSRRGVDSGDRVVIQIGPDDPFPWLVTYVGVHRARATAVPINTRLAPPELSAVIRHAEAALVVEAGAGPQAAEGPGPERVGWNVLLDDDPSPLPAAAEVNFRPCPLDFGLGTLDYIEAPMPPLCSTSALLD